MHRAPDQTFVDHHAPLQCGEEPPCGAAGPRVSRRGGLLLARSRGLVVVVVGLVVVFGFGLLAVAASAEPLCTDSWVGGLEGKWQTGVDWSAGHVPTSSDVACIGSGSTVSMTSGANAVSVLSVQGALVIREASLEVVSALEVSLVKSLTMEFGSQVSGAGTVEVSEVLHWNQGTMSGPGSTVVRSGASATLAGPTGTPQLKGRAFVNHGTVTLEGEVTGGARLGLSEGARFENLGVFNENDESIFGVNDEEKGAAASFINAGTFQTLENKGEARVEIAFENKGTVDGKSSTIAFRDPGYTVTLANASVLEGAVLFNGVAVSAGNFTAPAGSVSIEHSTMTIPTGVDVGIAHFVMDYESDVTGPGTLTISQSFLWRLESTMSGAGKTILQPGSNSEIKMGHDVARLKQRTLVNEGTMTLSEQGILQEGEVASFENLGTFIANSEQEFYSESLREEEPRFGEHESVFTNQGRFEKTAFEKEGKLTVIEIPFVNYGVIAKPGGELKFLHPVEVRSDQRWGCEENDAIASREDLSCPEGVDRATGNFTETQTDFAVGGRGVGLSLARNYNAQAAAEGQHGAFGYGWGSSFSDHIEHEVETPVVNLVQASGGVVPFTQTGGGYEAPKWTQDVLAGSEATGYSVTEANQSVYRFSGSTGRLESVTDRNGNATTLTYNGEGRLEKITDPAGRTIKFAYNGEGLLESAEDPMKHLVKYTYAAGNLASVTQPGEAGLRWQFEYDGSHRLTVLTDGRGNKTHYAYTNGKLTERTDPLERKTSYEYKPFETATTNVSTGAVTLERFTSAGVAASVTHGYGTALASTETRTHDSLGNLTSVADGNLHTTKYTYDGADNRLTMRDAAEHETKWAYNATHDIETETKPNGESTTYKRDSHGNPEVIERPAPGATTQSTSYKYDAHGNIESMTDPLKRVWKYEYDTAGDKTAETDPEGDKHTWAYNEDSQETTTVSPRGHVKAGEEAKYTTTTERDAQGRPIKVTDPLKHETKYSYDANGNLETKTDPELNKATYTYDADNERTKTKEPNGLVAETGYDGAGQAISQTDGNKHTTKYKRNVLEQVAEVVDPLARKTLKEYDKVGNLTAVTDPLKRTTSYVYDGDNRRSQITYSDGKTPTVKYEYNANGDRTSMTDGTGTTAYEYDQLDRLTATKDGHGNTAGYEYDLANEQTKITYPNGKTITRAYDNAGRLKSVTDWSEHTTKFTYDADSDLKASTFPTATSNEDTYTYDETDAIKEVKMTKGTETLASLAYARNKDGLVSSATTKGLPGEEKPAFTYDANTRLSKGAGTTYKYDEANNPTTIASTTYKYDAASELEKAEVAKTTTATYKYDELGERTKTTPASGPATTYGYDQAGRLTSVKRPKEGATPEIEDNYAYNGDGLRTSQTTSGTTTYMAWEEGVSLPLLLNDTTNSYIYGPDGLPIEQINNTTSTVLYLHHDQQGSTRLLTGSTGKTEATFTYDAYGNLTGHTGTVTTPLGYDGQYTNADTGLICLRAREYDPATGQFLSVDPKVEQTGAVYEYAKDNPLTDSDPTGEGPEESRVAHEFLSLESEGLKQLKRKHASSETVEFFQEIIKVHFFFEVAFAEGNGTLQRSGEQELHRIEKQLVGKFAPLASQEISLPALIKALRQIYHISVAVRLGARG
jgi:RHS repeat-associated protein